MGEVADQITVQCACGKKLRAPRNAVGRKARCAKCGNVFTIQAPPPPVPKQDDDGLGALYELAAEEKHASKNQVDDTPRCPQCISPLPAGGVVCTNCGFNVKSGKKLQTTVTSASGAAPGGALGAFGTAAPAEAPKKGLFGFGKSKSSSGKKTEDAMAPQGNFGVGVAMSVGGAIIGGVVWYVIAVTTGYWVGYVALLVGILAGLGMQMGQKGYSSLGGVAAAGIAAVAIILSSVAVVMGDVSELDSSDYDERVVDMLVDENLRAKGIDPENADFEEYDAAEEAAVKKLKNTSETEMKALIAKADELEAKEELEFYVAYDTMKRMKLNPDDASETQQMMARKQARQRIDTMTPAQREAEKKRLIAAHPEIAAHVQENAEESADSGEDEEGSSAGETAVFIVILFLVFGWKSLIFLLLAVSIAYKTAAGAVSD